MSKQNGIEAQFTRLAYHFARQYLFLSSFKIRANHHGFSSGLYCPQKVSPSLNQMFCKLQSIFGFRLHFALMG
jgi:hypothetical protein